MAFSDVTVPYELLIRYGEDGAPRGAHVQRRRIVEIDGERLKDEVLPAEPLSLEGFPTSAIMSDSLRDALGRVQQLQARSEELETQLDAAATTIEQAEEQIAQLRSQLAALQAEREAASAPVDTAATL